MPAALMSKGEVVDRLVDVFRRLGYDGASLSALSQATGLGRSSLYHYFPGGKEEMALAVIARVAELMRVQALSKLERPGPPRDRLQAMSAGLDQLYQGGRAACLFGNLVVGGSRALFQRELASVFGGWVEALERLAVEAGVPRKVARERAESAVTSIEGALVLSGGLGTVAPFKRALRRLPDELLAPLRPD